MLVNDFNLVRAVVSSNARLRTIFRSNSLTSSLINPALFMCALLCNSIGYTNRQVGNSNGLTMLQGNTLRTATNRPSPTISSISGIRDSYSCACIIIILAIRSTKSDIESKGIIQVTKITLNSLLYFQRIGIIGIGEIVSLATILIKQTNIISITSVIIKILDRKSAV